MKPRFEIGDKIILKKHGKKGQIYRRYDYTFGEPPFDYQIAYLTGHVSIYDYEEDDLELDIIETIKEVVK